MDAPNDTLLDSIKAYWTSAAAQDVDQDGLRPTARDPFLQEAVEGAIETYLHAGARLLDVGCGDGLSTMRFAATAGECLGLDYVPAFIERARRSAHERAIANVRFATADVLDLSELAAREGRFDVAVSIRCLINLASWDNQARALGQIAQLVKPGGLCLLSEGWAQGMQGLNLRRTQQGLSPIDVVRYNLLLDRGAFEQEARRYFKLVDYVGLGLYMYLSRVVQPLLVAPAAPRHDHPLNRLAARLQAASPGCRDFSDCDYAGVYVLRRLDA